MAKKKYTQDQIKDMKSSDDQEEIKTDIETILKNASENVETFIVNTERKARHHRRSHVKISVGEILKRIKSGKYIYPKFQRDYVWGNKQLKDLLWSMRNNYSAGAIIVSECEGQQYITDGLQRTMSFLHISTDSKLLIKKKKLTKDDNAFFQKESMKILEYEILVETVHDMTVEEMPEYFVLINGGIALKPAIKERSRLDPELRSAAMEISSMEFFKTVDKIQTFNTQNQSTVIAYCALLAAANEPIGEMKSRSLCNRLIGNREIILANQKSAIDIANRLPDIYCNIYTERTKKSMNAAFVGVLMFILANHPQYTNNDVARLINYIWENPNMSIDFYGKTLNGSGDVGQCKARYDLMVQWLENKPNFSFEEQGIKIFNNMFKDQVLKDSYEKHAVYYDSLNEDVKKELYVAHLNGDEEIFDSIIRNHGEIIES